MNIFKRQIINWNRWNYNKANLLSNGELIKNGGKDTLEAIY